MKSIAVIGAGVTGATIARVCAEQGETVDVFESQAMPGGAAADTLIDQVYVSLYGPHIFHTSNEEVWGFASRFSDWDTYDHRVRTLTDVGWLPWPINQETIERAFGVKGTMANQMWKNDIQISAQVYADATSPSFESKALAAVGRRMYELLLKGYTTKQWRRQPISVPDSIFRRVRVAQGSDESFFADTHVALPREGYTAFVRNILDHRRIHVHYQTPMTVHDVEDKMNSTYGAAFVTCPPDAFCGYQFGKLEYLSIDFQPLTVREIKKLGPFPTPVVNFAQESVYFTRVTDYAKMRGRISGSKETIIGELPVADGTPLYPVRTLKNILLAEKYDLLLKEYDVRAVGRLGGFMYVDMDEAIRDALVEAQGPHYEP